MSFVDLGLAPELLRAVSEKGYTEPTPIQAQAIPTVLSGRDVLAGAQTGTGKTAGFILPLLQKLANGAGPRRLPRAAVLAPTRELAAQIAQSARDYGKYLSVRTCVVFGGVSINPQIDALRTGCDLLIATPGRLLDLAEQRALNLSAVEYFVLDEADRMLDMGFIQPIRRILKLLPAARQNMMFSATYTPDIRELASRFLRDPVSIEVTPRNSTAERVEQFVYRVPREQKQRLLAHLIDDGGWHQVLVFTRTKHGANRLAQQLEHSGIRSTAIHGNKSQAARVRALDDFKSSKVTALVATEVAARGLDIKELPHVVNYELPNVPQDYVHRIGRTARAGATGFAVSLVAPDEAPLLRDIENLLRRSLPVTPTPALPAQTVSTAAGDARAPHSQRDPRSFGRRSHGHSSNGQRSHRHTSASQPSSGRGSGGGRGSSDGSSNTQRSQSRSPSNGSRAAPSASAGRRRFRGRARGRAI
jgi:ATP-dependent RNA helicase RhlE